MKPYTLRELILRNRDQCLTWCNRADMARQQGNHNLMLQALQRAHQFGTALATLIEGDPPEPPQKSEDVRTWLVGIHPLIIEKIPDLNIDFDIPPPPQKPPGDRLQPSRVPRKPLPFSGAGEIALPLPEAPEEAEDE